VTIQFVIILLAALGPSMQALCQAVDTGDGEAEQSWRLSDEVCRDVCFRRSNGGLFSCHQECNTEDEMRLPAGIDFLVKRMREVMFPPVFEEIDFTPEKPVAGEDLGIELIPYKGKSDYLLDLKVKLFYAFDEPRDWKNVAPETHQDGFDVSWSANIEVPGDAGGMYFLARAGDEDENTYVEIPCRTREPSIGSSDCFFPMSKDDTYENVEDFSVNPGLDLTEAFVAADERRYYFRIQAVGDIDPGELLPPDYNYYLLGIFDPGRPADVDPYHKTVFVIYAPNYFAGEMCSPTMYTRDRANKPRSPMCISEPCAVLMKRAAEWFYDTNSVKCDVKGNELFVSLQRNIIDPTSMGMLAAYIATGNILETESALIADYSPSTAIKPRIAEIEVLPPGSR